MLHVFMQHFLVAVEGQVIPLRDEVGLGHAETLRRARTRCSIGFLRRLDLFSSERVQIVEPPEEEEVGKCCSMTSSGLEMPPDQNASEIRSIWFFSSPVSMWERFYASTAAKLATPARR